MSDFPSRKPLRLKNYDYSQAGYYFITLCTYQNQKLFDFSQIGIEENILPEQTPQNKLIEKWLFAMENKFCISIDKYIIMPDHIHFILIIHTERHTGRSLPEMMQWFKTMTTNEYIRLVKNKTIKPFHQKIWHKSYHEHIIRNQDDYMAKLQYILNNPLKSSLSSNPFSP